MKNSIPVIEKSLSFGDPKKKVTIKMPDTSKMQMVEIDAKTTIYIALDASAEEARSRYSDYRRIKNKI